MKTPIVLLAGLVLAVDAAMHPMMSEMPMNMYKGMPMYGAMHQGMPLDMAMQKKMPMDMIMNKEMPMNMYKGMPMNMAMQKKMPMDVAMYQGMPMNMAMYKGMPMNMAMYKGMPMNMPMNMAMYKGMPMNMPMNMAMYKGMPMNMAMYKGMPMNMAMNKEMPMAAARWGQPGHAMGAVGQDASAEIVDHAVDMPEPGRYMYRFRTSNGIAAMEQSAMQQSAMQQSAMQRDALSAKVQGSYMWTGPDGQDYKVEYEADENGFRPSGPHLHPVPEAIQRALQWNEAHPEEDMAGMGMVKGMPVHMAMQRKMVH